MRALLIGLLLLLAAPTAALAQGNQYTPVAHQFLTGFNAFGRPIGAQPVIADLSDTAWTAYTPTLSCGSGTLTTATAAGRYKQIGKTVAVNIIITITTNGTCATWIIASLPMAANQRSLIAGREDGATSKMLQGVAGNSNSDLSHLLILNYDGTYPGANGALMPLTGVYETP